MTTDDELKGLGGWLIVLGIGVVVSPVRLVLTIVPTYIPIFEDGTWETLTTAGSELYSPYWGPLLIAEIIFNTAMFLGSLYLIYLFFTKHYAFPRIYIVLVAASLVFIPLDAWLVTKILPDVPMFDPETTQSFVSTLIGAAIWVPYLMVSKRVQATFVEHRPPVRASEA